MLKSVCVSLLALTVIVGHVECGALINNLCTRSGLFPLVDNTPIYYGCYTLPSGGYQLRYFECIDGDIFSSQFGRCVPEASNARDGSDIENPTIPPVATTTSANNHADNEDDDGDSSSSSESTPVVTPEPSSTESSSTEESSTESSSTEESSTESSSTESSSTEESSTESSSTEESSTESSSTESSSTENSSTESSSTASTESSVVTVEPVEPTEPSTSDEPAVTTDPSTTDPTDETSTDVTIIPTTDAPVTEPYQCIASGFFPRDNCKDFYYCVTFEGKLTAFEFTCPEGQLFNEDSKFCDATTTCATAPVQSSVDNLRLLRQEFECEVEGAYPYPGDCSKYYACSWDAKNNGFLSRAVKCPEGKVFDIFTGLCGIEQASTCQGR